MNKKLFKKLNIRQYFFIALFGVIGVVLLVSSFAATGYFGVEPEVSVEGCAQAVSDGSASGGAYAQFGSSANCGLDHSGKTIPAHNYTPPAGAIYMATNGNDANNGTSVNSPVKTISKAIEKVPENGTIVLRGGEYRDWHNVNGSIKFEGKSFTLQAYQDESPWFNGADIVTNWNSEGNNVWSTNWETPDFCGPGQYYVAVEGGKPPFAPNLSSFATSCVYGDSVKDSVTVAGDPQSVFINDTKLAQVPSLSQLTANTFFYDWYNKKMYIGQNPSGKKVELAKRTQALMLNKGVSGGYAIKGIGFKRYASGGSGGGNWTIANTVFANEPRSLVIENSAFVDNSYIGLGFSKPQNNGSKIVNSVFAYNGYAGLHGNGSRAENQANPNIRNDLLVEGNVFNANNDQQFDINCNPACGAANVKLNNMVGFFAKNNIVENALPGAYGLWCDIHCSDTVIVNNLVTNNAKHGIFYEISKDGLIANNLVINNGTSGIAVGSTRTKVYNNTVLFDRSKHPLSAGLDIFDDNRCPSCLDPVDGGPGGGPGIAPDTVDVELVNNIVVAKGDGLLSLSMRGPAVGTNTAPSQFYSKFDYNAYHRGSSDNLLYAWEAVQNNTEFIKSTAAFTNRTGWDGNSLDLAGGSDPFFVDIANGDYRVRQNSPAYNSGQPLPSDVAQAIGVPAGQTISRGALSWPNF